MSELERPPGIAGSHAAGWSSTVRAEEIRLKHVRVVELLDAHGADALHLTSLAMVAWATAGADVLVNWAGAPSGEVVIGRDAVRLVCTNIEAERFRNEQLPDDVELLTYPWHEPQERGAVLARLLGRNTLAEGDPAGMDGRALRTLRAPLAAGEVDRYRALGRDAAAAITDAVRTLTPGVTEHAVAARVAQECRVRGLQPTALMVGGDARLQRYRHPLPTARPIREAGQVILVARRHGLLASLSRSFSFGAVPARLAERQRAVLGVEAALWDATIPGKRLGDILQAGVDAYAGTGFDGAWHDHHQGGPTGYLGRDPVVLPGEARLARAGEAFAWNPTLPGVKAEDTVLLTGARAGYESSAPTRGVLEVLTVDPRWPTQAVAGRDRPAVLEL